MFQPCVHLSTPPAPAKQVAVVVFTAATESIKRGGGRARSPGKTEVAGYLIGTSLPAGSAKELGGLGKEVQTGRRRQESLPEEKPAGFGI